MKIYKNPEFENDSYMLVIEENDKLQNLDLSIYPFDYAHRKRTAFKKLSIDKKPFEKFSDRPSLTGLNILPDVSGSIYTYTCQSKNKLDYNHIIKFCRKFHKTSRRCAVNFADTLYDYLHGEINTSCLNSIHYCNDNVTLYFRASDIKNELLLDLHLIKEFFIEPVGEFKTITVIASTAQNVGTNLKTLVQ